MNIKTRENLTKIIEKIEKEKIGLAAACENLGFPDGTYKRYYKEYLKGVRIEDMSYTKIHGKKKPKQSPNPLNFFSEPQQPEPASYQAFEIEVESEKPIPSKPEEKQMTCIVLKGTNSEIQSTLKGLL